MNIVINESGITFKSIMKLIFAGYVIGMGLVLLPFFLMDLAGISELSIGVSGIIIMPLILAFQGLLFGLCINLGLFVYKRFKPITIENHRSEQGQNL